MTAPHLAAIAHTLDAIPHPVETRPLRGSLSATRWSRFLLNLVLEPTHWRKLGLAVQWAKWVEWDGGLDWKNPTLSPGILYLQNPLHPFTLNRLLNSIDFTLVDVETLIGCVETGDWTCLFTEEQLSAAPGTNNQLRDQAAESLEHLCLLSFYLRWSLLLSSAPATPAQGDDRLIQELVARILQDEAGATGRNKVWYQAFKEQALRLTSQQDPNNPQLPSKLSVLLNEVLEIIRLDRIRRDGWNDPKFAAQLPASWYSETFLRTTITLAKQFITTERQDRVRIPLQVQGLASIAVLWSYWMRKTGAEGANVLGQEMVELMAEILATPSFFFAGAHAESKESAGLYGACFSGLAMSLDKWSGLMEPTIVNGLVAGLERGRIVCSLDSDVDSIQASLATVLRSESSLDQNSEAISKVTVALLRDFYRGVEVETAEDSFMATISPEELFQIQRLFQFVVTQKAGLVPTKDSEDEKNKKRRRKKAKKPVVLKGKVWWEAIIHGIQGAGSSKDHIPSLLAIAGVLRAIQHGEEDPLKVDAESLALVEDIYATKLRDFSAALGSSRANFTPLPFQTQACLVFATCQTIPNLPACKLPSQRDCFLLAESLVNTILESNSGVMPLGEILRVVGYELARENNRCPLTGEAHRILNRTVKDSLFTEMGRVARTVSTLIEGILSHSADKKKRSLASAGSVQYDQVHWGQIEGLVQKMHSFAVNAHVDWARCGLSASDSFVESQTHKADDEGQGLYQDQETVKTKAMLFQVFKTLLFAYTMIFGTVVEKLTSEPVPKTMVAHLDYLILDSYAFLFFITYRLGPGGFQVYEELITTVLTRMVLIEGDSNVVPQDGEEPVMHPQHILLNETLRAMKPTLDIGSYHPVRESRILFFMNLLERVMVAVEEQPLLEDELLPMVYPYLLKNDQRDLFESAHSVVMSVFLTKKKIAKQVAPFYTRLLLDHFPNEITIDQLRAAFTTMIRALSETEDALAWLCVERLLEKIEEYDTQAEAEIARGAITAVPGRDLEEKALIEVATDLHQDLTPQDAPSLLPSLSTTVPSPASLKSLGSMGFLERQKERGQLLLALFDQLSSLNLVFVETLGQKIRSLLVRESSPVGRRALLKCLLDVIGGPAVDHTKRDWA
ncbi:hypothetical protein BGW38_004700, partial [Lunasporangiospora selenospora]